MYWTDRCASHTSVGLSPNGWTDDLLCLEWFKKTFIPQARARTDTPGEPILLIFDGHGSHVTHELLRLAFETPDIHLYCLPPHTTHKLQPLDVGIFGPLQKAWSERCEEVVGQTGEGIRREDVVKEYMAARQKTFEPELIRKAFERSGLNPINKDIFSASDFAPSTSTSTISHMPSSYPIISCQPSLVSAASSSPSTTEDPRSMPAHRVNTRSHQTEPARRCRTVELEDDSGEESAANDSDDLDGPDSDNEGTIPEFPHVILHHLPPDVPQQQPLYSHPSCPPSPPVLPALPQPTPPSTSRILPEEESGSIEPRTAPSITLNELSAKAHEPAIELTPMDPRWCMKRKLEVSVEDNIRLLSEVRRLRNERDAAVTHAQLALHENGLLRIKAYGKDNRRKRRKVSMPEGARYLTGEEGKASYEREEAERQRAEQEKENRRIAQEEKDRRDAERRRQVARAEDTTKFSGGLSRKTKSELQDIAAALHISILPKHQKKDIIDLISNHLRLNEDTLRANERFSGLYMQPRASAVDTNITVRSPGGAVPDTNLPQAISRACTPSPLDHPHEPSTPNPSRRFPGGTAPMDNPVQWATLPPPLSPARSNSRMNTGSVSSPSLVVPSNVPYTSFSSPFTSPYSYSPNI